MTGMSIVRFQSLFMTFFTSFVLTTKIAIVGPTIIPVHYYFPVVSHLSTDYYSSVKLKKTRKKCSWCEKVPRIAE